MSTKTLASQASYCACSKVRFKQSNWYRCIQKAWVTIHVDYLLTLGTRFSLVAYLPNKSKFKSFHRFIQTWSWFGNPHVIRNAKEGGFEMTCFQNGAHRTMCLLILFQKTYTGLMERLIGISKVLIPGENSDSASTHFANYARVHGEKFNWSRSKTQIANRLCIFRICVYLCKSTVILI